MYMGFEKHYTAVHMDCFAIGGVNYGAGPGTKVWFVNGISTFHLVWTFTYIYTGKKSVTELLHDFDIFISPFVYYVLLWNFWFLILCSKTILQQEHFITSTDKFYKLGFTPVVQSPGQVNVILGAIHGVTGEV